MCSSRFLAQPQLPPTSAIVGTMNPNQVARLRRRRHLHRSADGNPEVRGVGSLFAKAQGFIPRSHHAAHLANSATIIHGKKDASDIRCRPGPSLLLQARTSASQRPWRNNRLVWSPGRVAERLPTIGDDNWPMGGRSVAKTVWLRWRHLHHKTKMKGRFAQALSQDSA